jgi:hypothetical protein
MARTRPGRGRIISESSSNFESSPGRTVPVLPMASRVCRATTAGETACPMRIAARSANPECTGPGAEAITSTPRPLISCRSPSAKVCTKALVAA